MRQSFKRRPKLGLVTLGAVLGLASAIFFACNVTNKATPGQLEAVESIHHGGRILLWWSPDGDVFYVKPCEEVVTPGLAIQSLEAMKAACKGPVEPTKTNLQALKPMMVQIAAEDAGFDGVLKDQAKIELLGNLRTEISDNQWYADDVKSGLDALEAQLKDLALNLEKTQKEIATMRATAEAAAQAAGRVATEDDLDAIFGQTYRETQKALKKLEDGKTSTKTEVEAKLKEYQDLVNAVKLAQTKLEGVVQAVLDKIADKQTTVTVSLLQRENFEFALLQSAAIRLGLLKSHAPEQVTCKQVCSEDSPFADRSRCYACRCKEAMGGSLPSPAEINCKVAKKIEIYKLKAGGPNGFEQEPQAAEPESCWNPALLYGDCMINSKLGQLTKGDVTYKWICRHRSHPTASDATYGDVGVIAHNVVTGASCWWDDTGGSITDDDFPKLDLSNATQAEIDRNKSVFYNTTGEGCTGCHDNDPFMFSPYLTSVEWKTGDYTSAPYSTVQLDGSLKMVASQYLNSDEAASCTACHRIASGSTCSSWAPQSMGVGKRDGHEALVENSIDKLEGTTRKPGENWQLAYWMPPSKPFTKGTFEKWHEKHGIAKEHILKCCNEPTAQGCAWVNANGDSVTPE